MNTLRRRVSSPNDLRALVETELSVAARVGQVTLLLAFVAMTGVIGLLGVAEPSLPPGARMVFGVIIAIGAAGAVFALWTLSVRGAVLARHRVIGCRAAVGFAATIVAGASIIGFVKGVPAAFPVAGFGVLLLVGTIALLRQANGQLAALTARRDALARQLKIVR